MIYGVYCTQCDSSKYFEYYNKTENELLCKICKSRLTEINNVEIVYKVVK